MAIDKVWIYDTSGFMEEVPWTPAPHEGSASSILTKLHKKWKVEEPLSSWRDGLANAIDKVETDHPVHEILKSVNADADMRAVAALDYVWDWITLQGFKSAGTMVNCKEKENAWFAATTPKIF